MSFSNVAFKYEIKADSCMLWKKLKLINNVPLTDLGSELVSKIQTK